MRVESTCTPALLEIELTNHVCKLYARWLIERDRGIRTCVGFTIVDTQARFRFAHEAHVLSVKAKRQRPQRREVGNGIDLRQLVARNDVARGTKTRILTTFLCVSAYGQHVTVVRVDIRDGEPTAARADELFVNETLPAQLRREAEERHTTFDRGVPIERLEKMPRKPVDEIDVRRDLVQARGNRCRRLAVHLIGIDERDPLTRIVFGMQCEEAVTGRREVDEGCAVKEKPPAPRKRRCFHGCEIRGAFFAGIVVDDEAADDVV